MRTHFKTDPALFANSFLLFVIAAGVLNIDRFERDAVSCYADRKVLYHIELVFNREHPSQSPVLSVSEDIPRNDGVKDRALPSHSPAICFRTALLTKQSTRQVNARPFCSFHNPARSFNIPHQNSEEGEAFIFTADVA